MGTKNVQGNKNVHTSQNEVHKVPIAMEAKFYIHIMELNGHVCLAWPYMALHGLIWPCMALHDIQLSDSPILIPRHPFAYLKGFFYHL